MMSSWDVSWAHARLLEWGWAVRHVTAFPQQRWHGNSIGNILLPRIIPCQPSTPPPQLLPRHAVQGRRGQAGLWGASLHFRLLSPLPMSLAISIPSGPLHPRRLSHVFCMGRGLQGRGSPSREGLSPGTISQVPSPLARAVLEKAGLNKRHPPSKKNLKLLLMVFNWAAPSQLN